MKKISEILKLMRVKHYVKNVYVWFAIVFSGSLFDYKSLLSILFAFLAFSFTSSFVYIINDIKDIEKDRLHEKKKKRPLASGKISIKLGVIIAFASLVVAAVFDYLAVSNTWGTVLYLLGYILINIAYSLKLKNIPLVDVAIIVVGFMLRMMYGAAVIGVEISGWLYLTAIAGSFFQALGKRRNEISKNETGKSREVLKSYTREFLDKNMYMCMTLTIVFYSLWCVDPATIVDKNGELLIWSIPLVLLVCMKYSMILEGNSDGDPVDVILSNKLLILLVLGLATLLGIAIYL